MKVCKCLPRPRPNLDPDLGLRCDKCGGDLLARYPKRLHRFIMDDARRMREEQIDKPIGPL